MVSNLHGALGKTSARSYKAAPRQLLQVDPGASSSPTLSHAAAHISKPPPKNEAAAQEAAKLGRAALGNAADVGVHFLNLQHALSICRLSVLFEKIPLPSANHW